MKHWIYGPVVAALATWSGMAASAVADAPPLDLEVKKTDVGASGNAEVANQATGDKAANNSQCAAFESNINADVGDIIRAGCKPTTSQMRRLG